MMMSLMDDDPGWQLSWKSILVAFIPGLALRRSAMNHGADPLVALRKVFVSFSAAMVGVTLVVFVLGDMTTGDEPTRVSIAGVVGFGVVSLILGRTIKRDLDCSSTESLLESYRNRFFFRLAFAESAALVGFLATIRLGPWWVYFFGLGFTVLGFALLAPSRRNLAADQRALGANGCHRLLSAALRTELSNSRARSL